ncbi:GH25 family lysozyme [Paraburkholderia sp. UCT2]|uniref:GH25 family lysozyme n=1 Tax=Paraburkholderia sp. UCT2 TaxID=2615208 RepID=UPI003974F2BE
MEEGSGKAPIIYTYPSFWTHGMANASLFTKQHLWIANYGTKRVDGGFEPRGIAPIIPGGWPDVLNLAERGPAGSGGHPDARR